MTVNNNSVCKSLFKINMLYLGFMRYYTNYNLKFPTHLYYYKEFYNVKMFKK